MLFVGERELQTQGIVFVEAVPLESIYYNSGLERVLEVRKAENEPFFRLLFSRDKSNRPEAWERSENVRNFSLGCVRRQTFYVDSSSSVAGKRKQLRSRGISRRLADRKHRLDV